MFDNSKPNVIFLSDMTETVLLGKTIGPYKVANELRKAGFESAVIHHLHVFSFEELKHVLSNLISDQTLFVGFNNMFYRNISHNNQHNIHEGGSSWGPIEPGSMLPHGKNYNEILKKLVKELNPRCKLLLGGPTAKDKLYNKDFDYVVGGYADMSIVNLARHLQGQEPLRKSHKSIHGFVFVADLVAEGFDFANSEMHYEDHDCILPGETLPIEISRGCIFRCAFCAYPLNGKKKLDYIKNSELIHQEFMRNYQQHGITKYLFLDDTYNDSVEKVKAIYDISQRLPFQLEYWAYVRLDLIVAHPETLDWLFDSGLRACYFGLETFNHRTGQIIGKGMRKEKLLDTLRKIKQKWGDQVMTHGSFIAGLPEESKESVIETFEFLLSDQNPLDSWHMNPFRLTQVETGDNGFNDAISNDPAKFGYFNLKPMHDGYYSWENEHMNFDNAKEICVKYMDLGEQTNRLKLLGQTSIIAEGMNIATSMTRNKGMREIDWQQLDQAKQQRAQQYKDLIYKNFQIPCLGI